MHNLRPTDTNHFLRFSPWHDQCNSGQLTQQTKNKWYIWSTQSQNHKKWFVSVGLNLCILAWRAQEDFYESLWFSGTFYIQYYQNNQNSRLSHPLASYLFASPGRGCFASHLEKCNIGKHLTLRVFMKSLMAKAHIVPYLISTLRCSLLHLTRRYPNPIQSNPTTHL